jgi:hypothetical protein
MRLLDTAARAKAYFSEAFDTSDLKDAKVLEELGT